MTGVIKTQAQLLAEMPIGGPAGGITPQQLQDFIVSIVPVGQTATSGPVTMTGTKLSVNNGTTSPITVTSPAAMIPWNVTYRVADAGQNCASYNITITLSTGVFLNAPGGASSSVVMNVNGMSLSWEFDGTNSVLV